jgi:hypothetical protein
MQAPLFRFPGVPDVDTLTVFWVSIALCLLYPLVALPNIREARKGRLGKQPDGRPLKKLSLAYITLTLTNLVGINLYYPLMINLVQIVGCSSMTTMGLEDRMQLNADIVCWEGTHLWAVISMVVAVCLFYPLASFMLPNMQFVNNALDIKFDSTFLVFGAQGKLLLAGVFTFFRTAPALLMGAATINYVTLLVLCYTFQPCLVKRINRWKTLSYAVPAWCHLCALLYVVGFDGDQDYSTGMLVLMATGIVLFTGFTFARHHKQWGFGCAMQPRVDDDLEATPEELKELDTEAGEGDMQDAKEGLTDAAQDIGIDEVIGAAIS